MPPQPPPAKRPKATAREPDPVDREWTETFHAVFWPDWLALGRKCSKAAALKAWERIPHRDGQPAFDRLDRSLTAAKALWQSEDRPVRCLPHAATWLNDYAANLRLEA